MNAEFILDAIRAKYPGNAIVPELTIDDPTYADHWQDHWEVDNTGVEVKATRHPTRRRIDALMFQSLERTAIEIKVTKQDYSLDTMQKRWPWMRVSHRFIYAVPHDLDVMSPHGCGLWKVHTDGHIEVVKKSIINRVPEHLPQHVIQRLAYRASNHVSVTTDPVLEGRDG